MTEPLYFLTSVITLLVAIYWIWRQIWLYFIKQYPALKSQFFPKGNSFYIPPKEVYNRDIYKEILPLFLKDLYIRRRVQIIAILFAVLVLCFLI